MNVIIIFWNIFIKLCIIQFRDSQIKKFEMFAAITQKLDAKHFWYESMHNSNNLVYLFLLWVQMRCCLQRLHCVSYSCFSMFFILIFYATSIASAVYAFVYDLTGRKSFKKSYETLCYYCNEQSAVKVNVFRCILHNFNHIYVTISSF